MFGTPSAPATTSLFPSTSPLFTGGTLGATPSLTPFSLTPGGGGMTPMATPGTMGSPLLGGGISQVQEVDRKHYELRASGGGRRGGRGEGVVDMSPLALQSYKQMPRSAAKIIPRGMQRRESYNAALQEEQHARMVSPGSDSYLGRGVKDLEVDGEGIFASESKILDRDEGGDGGLLSTQTFSALEEHKDGELVLGSRGSPLQLQPSPVRGGRNPHAPILTKQRYWSEPTVDVLQQMTDEELSCLPEFKVVHESVGKITWKGPVDVRGQNLDQVVMIEHKMVKVYPDQREGEGYPARGTKLNRPAIIEFYNVQPTGKKTEEQYRAFLRQKTEGWEGAKFLDYDYEGCIWRFSVQHFSGYGLTEEDEEEEDEVIDKARSAEAITGKPINQQPV